MLATAELIGESAQAERLAAVLPGYLSRTPLYRRTGAATAGARGPLAPTDLLRLPFITKQDIRRDFPRNFLGDGEDLESLIENDSIELEHTSGTSEERTPLILPRGWWAKQERRALGLNAIAARVLEEEPEARRATISSPVCSSEICYTGVPTRDERIVGNTLFLTLSRLPFLWSDSELARMAEEVIDWEPRFLDVDPVYGVVFARYLEREGIRLPSLSFVLCSYEYVSVTHRRILERVFRVPVLDLYGSTETGHLLMEDITGEMRPSLQIALLEAVEPDPAGIGDLVVTTLTNDLMPLVRYRIGDLIQRTEEPYRTRYILHGRAADAFHTQDGRRITTRQVDECFAGVQGILHYQSIEQPENRFCFRFVPDRDGPLAGDFEALQDRLCSLFRSPEKIQFAATDLLMPESSGKFRLGYPIGKERQ